jgi:hypothetical protein
MRRRKFENVVALARVVCRKQRVSCLLRYAYTQPWLRLSISSNALHVKRNRTNPQRALSISAIKSVGESAQMVFTQLKKVDTMNTLARQWRF